VDANVHLVLLPVLASAVLVAALGLVQRAALVGKSVALFQAAAYGAAFTCFCLTYIWWWGLSWPPHLRDGFWRVVIAGGVINAGIQYLHAKSLTYKAGEVSLVTLLSAMTPGLVTIVALALGEMPGLAGIAGIALMVVGSWILLTKDKPEHWWGYLKPFKMFSLLVHYQALAPKDRERAKVIGLALGSACLSTFGLLAVGLYARRAGDFQGIWAATIVNSGIVTIAFILLNLRRPLSLVGEWRGQWVVFALGIAVYAALLVGANYLEVPAFAETYVAYVGTLNRSRILFSIVLVWILYKMGFVLFGEEDLKKRFVAALIIIAGATLIASEGLPGRISDKLVFFGF